MSYARSTTIDYITDKIGKNSASIGAVKKLDTDLTAAFEALTELQCNYYGSTEPTSPVAGESWYDSSVGYKKVYDGATWTAEAAAAGISNVVEDTTPEQGGDLDRNQFCIVYDPSPTADHTWNGDTEVQTAGENVVIGDICYLKSDGKFWRCDADVVTTTAGMLRMATASILAAATGVFLVKGYIRDDTWNWTIGAELYVSVTPGNATATAPSGDGDIKRIIGHAMSADVIFFNPSQTYIELEV